MSGFELMTFEIGSYFSANAPEQMVDSFAKLYFGISKSRTNLNVVFFIPDSVSNRKLFFK